MMLFKALFIGFLLSTPISPIGILCFRRALECGSRTAFFSGLGSATADFIITIFALLGLSWILDILDVHEQHIRIVGDIFLIFFGLYILKFPPHAPNVSVCSRSNLRAFFSIFLLTLSNPATIPSFATFMVAFGFHPAYRSLEILSIAISVFVGAMIWWSMLATGIAFIHPAIRKATLKKINTGCGIILILFGTLSLLKSLVLLW